MGLIGHETFDLVHVVEAFESLRTFFQLFVGISSLFTRLFSVRTVRGSEQMLCDLKG